MQLSVQFFSSAFSLLLSSFFFVRVTDGKRRSCTGLWCGRCAVMRIFDWLTWPSDGMENDG